MNPKTAIVFIILFNSYWLYSNSLYQDNKRQEINSGTVENDTWYEVTETINMPFGKSIVIYNVSNKKLINNYDLGPNNTRVVVEKTKAKAKKGNDSHSTDSNIINNPSIGSNSTANENTTVKTTSINPIETYERMANNGIKSIDIFKNLGDSYFYKNEYVKAIKYYEALFKMTHDLEPEYYFRYSNALKNMGQIASSEELFEKYKLLIAKQKN